MRIGKRLLSHAVDHAEDGGVAAYAEGEREDGDEGEAGRLPQRAQRVAHVLRERLDRMKISHVTCRLRSAESLALQVWLRRYHGCV